VKLFAPRRMILKTLVEVWTVVSKDDDLIDETLLVLPASPHYGVYGLRVPIENYPGLIGRQTTKRIPRVLVSICLSVYRSARTYEGS
jgi:hypothetical protein